jgi:hypothetical protein
VLLDVMPPTRLGVEASRAVVRFGEAPKAPGTWAGSRLLWVDDRGAFESSYWCGTCPFLFQRLDGATRTLSLAALADALADGIDHVDATVVDMFAGLLPDGTYLPMLLRVRPTLVSPGEDGDYFTHEQVATWGANQPGLPEDPGTPYYRTFATRVDDEAHLYEFVVPMVPPSWNDPARTQMFRDRLGRSDRPTAVAVSTLDISQPAMHRLDSSDDYAHWGLTHFLLDGHHKMHAAATAGHALQLLALVCVDASLARPQDVERLPVLRRQEHLTRPPGAVP